MSDASWMADVAAKYQTVVTLRPAQSAGLHRALPNNPKRFYVEFYLTQGALSSFYICPGPVPAGMSNQIAGEFPLKYKFSDCPSIVTGEFYANDDGAASCVIIECLYVGND